MNEGHASLLTLELLEEQKRSRNGQAVNGEDVSASAANAFLPRILRWLQA